MTNPPRTKRPARLPPADRRVVAALINAYRLGRNVTALATMLGAQLDRLEARVRQLEEFREFMESFAPVRRSVRGQRAGARRQPKAK